MTGKTKRVVTLEQSTKHPHQDPSQLEGFEVVEDKEVECDHPNTRVSFEGDEVEGYIVLRETCSVCGHSEKRKTDTIIR